MDNQDEPPLCSFGTPLEPLEEDDVPLKKRIAIEDQVVTDENGRRRFHGAFTGGFSAGFWNTVGSLEGWKPQSFKSSRSEKAEKRGPQLPTDFMDDEDLGEFGIAPQRVQAKEDFSINDESSKRKRILAWDSGGAIPGVAALQQILEASREKVAVRLLRRMGWKPGQGVGRRQTRKEKKQLSKLLSKENVKIYGCALKPDNKPSQNSSEESSDISDNEDLDFAPDDFEPLLCVIKDNTFGLGYSGLNRQSSSTCSSHINLFGPLEIMGRGNKKLSIRGQAFGVGALEEEDEDIYAKDDMSSYDFSLSNKRDKRKEKNAKEAQDQTILEGFSESHQNLNAQKIVHQIDLKPNFQPRNWLLKKSRFEPLTDKGILTLKQNDDYKNHGLGRHDLSPSERGKLLEDNVETKGEKGTALQKISYLKQISEKYKERERKGKTMLDLLSSKAHNFVKGGLITDSGNEIIQSSKIQTNAETHKIFEKKESVNFEGSSVTSFKPFVNDEAKQERYEKFLQANLQDEVKIKDFLSTIQPINLSEWDREREHKEFVQARNIYKPLNGLMSERFVSKSVPNKNQEQSIKETNEKPKVIVIRTKTSWKPHNVICKRFNIPEPFGDSVIELPNKKRNKFSVFDYIEHSVNTKEDFVTPVIIPKHIEKPKGIQTHQMSIYNTKKELSLNSSDKDVTPHEKLTLVQPHVSPTLTYKITNTIKTKTELEIKIQESKNKHPSEKKDLFKCIFESSSEDEQEEDGQQATKNQDVTLESTTSAEIVKTLIKPTIPVNILRNNSPPRGIFAALFTKSLPKTEDEEIAKGELQNKLTLKPESQSIIQNTMLETNEVYGPKVAVNFATEKNVINKDKDIDKRLAELLSKKEIKDSTLIEKWVEKFTEASKDTKKNKKEKRKHESKKKHKSKHKKSKKKKKIKINK